MLKVLSLIAVTMMVSASAFAEVTVPYGQWVSLPHCGGATRLTCEDVSNARQSNRCHIEFSKSYNCSQIELYVASDYYPKYETESLGLRGSFYVDNNKINHAWTNPNFRVYLHSDDKSVFEQVRYEFNY